MSDDIVDRIDALVDWQLAKGEPDPAPPSVVLPSPRMFFADKFRDLPPDVLADVVAVTESIVRGAIAGVFYAMGLPHPEVRFE